MGVSNPPIVKAEVNYPEVVTHADLPDATGCSDEIYAVLVGTGMFGINRKRAGLWRSDGLDWHRLGTLEGSGGVVYSTPTTGMTLVRGVVYDEINKEIVYKI